jgi:BirA family transcriptional regulator, biotin operon repressor / biotin---[acetyl-CoA-carboxylase] ligase
MGFDVDAVRARLPGRRIEWFPSVDSTMTVAARLAREGCASGTAVVADEQTAGVGRHGHSWHSEAGAGLYVSMVLRPPIDAAGLPIVMLALGLAAREAIVETSGLAADLRWPNDVLLGGKKCAGILAQIEDDAIVAGIGINVNHTIFPTEIAVTATSLRMAGAGTVSREELLVALIEAVEEFMHVLAHEGADAILNLFSNVSSYAEGRRVRIEQDGAAIEGVTCGLDAAGFLRVRQDDGTELKILAGGVRPA